MSPYERKIEFLNRQRGSKITHTISSQVNICLFFFFSLLATQLMLEEAPNLPERFNLTKED